MSLLANSNAIEDAGYNIQRSLRFRSSASAYLSRTPASTTNRRTWTVSFWIKRGKLATGTEQVIFSSNNGSTYTELNYLASSDVLRLNLAAGGSPYYFDTSAVFRDPSAWYHVVVAVDTTQATSTDRMKLYINNVQQAGSNNAPSLNYDTDWNRAQPAYIGARTSGSWFNECYLAEFNNIDGQALTPSSFGQTDPVTGVWTPKKYTGTYGTNGFYLPFSDNTSATTLAYDKSGNGNNWTPNNISTTAGATYDSMTDVPTLTSATAANYCVLNPLDKGTGVTLSDANLKNTGAPTGWYAARGSMSASSGKWYFEVTVLVNSFAANGTVLGIMRASNVLSAASLALFAGVGCWGYENNNGSGGGYKANNGTITAYGATFTTNDVIGCAFDIDAGSIEFFKNGISQGIAFSSQSFGEVFPFVAVYSSDASAINCGQRPFSYTPPTGFKALNTFNLPDPTIKKPNQYMDATTYTGNGSTQTITNAAGFQPDLVWNKSRSVAASHELYDSVRGATNRICSNLTQAEDVVSGVTSFNANGYSLGSGTGSNSNGNTFVGWQWQAGKGTTSSNTSGSITSTVSVNATAGFSVVTYTTPSSFTNSTIGHGLGVAPSMIIVKSRSAAYGWSVWHTSLGTNGYLVLNSTSASGTNSQAFNGTSSTTFTIGSDAWWQTASATWVAYCWAQIAGFSKFGSYTGNGSADGPFVFTNFRPKYVMVKCSSSTGDWVIVDTARGTYNVVGPELYADLSNAEATGNNFDVTSNGFKLRGSWNGVNGASATYIYAAFAENPFKYSNAR